MMYFKNGSLGVLSSDIIMYFMGRFSRRPFIRHYNVFYGTVLLASFHQTL